MDQILFSSPLFKIGRFSISPKVEDFYKQDLIKQPTIVFPRNSIWIQHHSQTAFVADTSIVNFYNHNQQYTRRAIHPNGDDCYWIKLSKELLTEMVPEAGNNKYQDLFMHQNLPCEKSVFLNQMHLLKLISTQDNKLLIEEKVLDLVEHLLRYQLKNTEFKSLKQTKNTHRVLVENVKSSILENLSSNKSLKQLAKMNHTSAFHLSRVFKRVCGYGINQYRTEQRLRNIALKIQNGNQDLAYLAMDYGFSSHSHLTSRFKKHFNKTPTQFAFSI